MQTESPTEKKLVQISRLADQINNKYKEAIRLAGESLKSGNAAVIAAINCGKLLGQAKEKVGHGRWLKWLDDNCPDMSDQTARNWMRLSNSKGVLNLDNCSSLTKAYITCGILPEPKPITKAIGTGEVDIYEMFAGQIVSHTSKVYELTEDVDIQDIPPERRASIKAQLEPLVRFYEGL